MKYRVVIPDQDFQPLPGETPADAVRRASIGRVLHEVPVERADSDEDRAS